jgi:small GTP-binding protein
MSKKIIFVGPPGVGKTTLRKIFFEYQSAEQLMKCALDPTYGAESIVLNLGQQIGVFDLAGQENYRWLETGEKEIFADSTHILAVVDVTSSIGSIVEFTSKLVEVRDQICPRATIFLLTNKIDLLSQDELEDKKKVLYSKLKQIKLIKIEFTSILRTHFLRTLKIFKNIIDAVLGDEILLESVDTLLINDSIAILNLFKGSTTLSIVDLLSGTQLSQKRVKTCIASLVERNLVEEVIGQVGGEPNYKLANAMNPDIVSMLGSYSREKLGLVEHGLSAHRNDEVVIETPPFIGFFIADLNGRTILMVESREGVMKQCIGMDDEKNIDLIPPFISALTSFSKEIHIVNMADFKIKGQNAIMYIFERDQFNLIMFLSPDTNIDMFKAEIQGFFKSLIEKYATELRNMLKTGNVADLDQMHQVAKDWLLELEEKYQFSADDVEFFDMTRAQQLYTLLDELLQGSGKNKSSMEAELRLLKRRLITAIMEKDHRELREIAKISHRIAPKK